MNNAWLWTAATVNLLSAGAFLAVWALFWDRAHGRRRCPKCWYDMTHLPAPSEGGKPAMRCPECGRVAKKERHLRRTRRRLGAVLPVLLLLVLAYESWAVPRIKMEGWTGAVPTTVIITLVGPPLTDPFAAHGEWFAKMQAALDRRCKEREVWSWQRDVWRLKAELAFALHERLSTSAANARALGRLKATPLPPTGKGESLDEFLSRVQKEAGVEALAGADVRNLCGDQPLRPAPLACSAAEALDCAFGMTDQPSNIACGWGLAKGSIILTSPPPTVLTVYDARDLLLTLWAGKWSRMTTQPPARSPDFDEYQDVAQDLTNLITCSVRTEDWTDNGGDRASVHFLNGRVLVVAPVEHQDEVHGLLSMLRAPGGPDHAVYAPGSTDGLPLFARLDSAIVDLRPDTTSLGQLVDQVARQTGVRIACDWTRLGSLALHPETPCRITATRQIALDVLLVATDPGGQYRRVTITPRQGVLVFEPRTHVRRVIAAYDLSDFLEFKETGKPNEDVYRDLCDIISGLVETESWVDNGGDEATMRMFGSKLIIQAPALTHYQVQKLLSLIRAGRSDSLLRAINAAETNCSYGDR